MMNFNKNIFTLALLLASASTHIDLTASQAAEPTKPSFREYFQGAYPANHWAVQPYKLSDPKVVALARYKSSQYAIYMNPTDKRGYRSIVRFINNENMPSTLNRNYTTEERIGLGLSVALMTEVYGNIVPISQNAVAGNNSHAFDAETGTPKVGIPQEPSFLHGHVWGRGNPKGKYVEDVELDGPTPGLNFDMMAKTFQPKKDGTFELQQGNDKKANWKNGDMEKVVRRLKDELKKTDDAYKAQGLSVTVE